MELEIKNVSKKFDDFFAVNSMNLTMNEGVYGLLGVNGAGKTTLMRMLCTLLKPTTGQITYNGKDIFTMDSDYRKLLGYLPQDFGYYPDFTIYDYLMYISSIKGIDKITAKKRVKELLELVGLTKEKNKRMKTLSGGMKRRTGIAQAMLNNPQILILDEPTAGLDPNERIRFRNLISEISEERLVLLSTHIVSDIEYIASNILLMKGGKIVLKGTANELIQTMPESVWKCYIDKKEIQAVIKSHKIANIKTETNNVEIRVISKEKPFQNAIKIETTLEDVFLYYFGEKDGGNNV